MFIEQKGPTDRAHADIHTKDAKDFTVESNRSGIIDYIKLLLFAYFTVVLLMCFFMIGAVNFILKLKKLFLHHLKYKY